MMLRFRGTVVQCALEVAFMNVGRDFIVLGFLHVRGFAN